MFQSELSPLNCSTSVQETSFPISVMLTKLVISRLEIVLFLMPHFIQDPLPFGACIILFCNSVGFAFTLQKNCAGMYWKTNRDASF